MTKSSSTFGYKASRTAATELSSLNAGTTAIFRGAGGASVVTAANLGWRDGQGGVLVSDGLLGKVGEAGDDERQGEGGE